MRVLKWMVAALTLALVVVVPITVAWAQLGLDGLPPNRFHPFRGATNCIQVVDALGNFGCAPGTKVDPATGNMVVGGSLAFGTLSAGTFSNGLALAAVNSGVQLLGAGDFVLSTSPSTIAPSGPLIRGVVFRVRSAGPGLCQVVVAGGNGLQEFVIPVVPTPSIYQILPGIVDAVQLTFPGGPSGC